MNAKRILAIAIAMIGLYACQKEPISDSQNILLKKSSPNYWTQASNSGNPYEYLAIGVYHNNCIEYFRTLSKNFPSKADWVDARFQITLDFFCFGSDTLYCDSKVSLDDLIHIDSVALNDSLFNLQVAKLPSEVSTDVNDLLDFFDYYDMTEYNELKSAIVSFESTIISDSTKNEDYKEMLLIASQVARYSSLYWKEQIENNFYGWSFSDYHHVEWKETSKHDIKGAIIGYLYGLDRVDPIASSIKGGPLSSSSSATKSSLLVY